MTITCFNIILFVSLAILNWTNSQESGAMISALMKKHASFGGNLPLTRACYHLELENTSLLQCASQCLTRIDLCYGFLLNQESKTCKLVKCIPSDSFSVRQFDTGLWDLFWNENGINYTSFYKYWWSLSVWLFGCLALSLSLSLSLSQ